MSTVSSKGQVVIPREIREAYGLRAGDKVDFTRHGDHIHLKKLGDPLEEFLSGPKVRLEPGQVERMLKERF